MNLDKSGPNGGVSATTYAQCTEMPGEVEIALPIALASSFRIYLSLCFCDVYARLVKTSTV
ncbi:hypothetical protein [Methylococcus sp. Mc7]|uniref:hypothetical protein n=1 Tax=Methylococcus sp. Mc7 TaxID=2860258 RepID=UPI001C527633|nr:hypothetical protein [Methylococcus sp. Mc7]QXP85892.1 hypothetical protein KW115_09450 [Methylococcus sp. Mc7]